MQFVFISQMTLHHRAEFQDGSRELAGLNCRPCVENKKNERERKKKGKRKLCFLLSSPPRSSELQILIPSDTHRRDISLRFSRAGDYIFNGHVSNTWLEIVGDVDIFRGNGPTRLVVIVCENASITSGL